VRIVKLRVRQRRVPLHESGFTFNEVLVAINVIVIGVLGYSLTTVGVIRGNRANDNATIAINLAQDKMEQLRAQRKLVNDNRCPGDRAITATGAPGGIFDRCWRIFDSSFGLHLKQIDVTVAWREPEIREIIVTTLMYTE
jgi:Tfp pilus assembly protein PilV